MNISFSGDIQAPPGRGAVQPAVGDPASAGVLDWRTHRGPFQPRTFCDSVISSSEKRGPAHCLRHHFYTNCKHTSQTSKTLK